MACLGDSGKGEVPQSVIIRQNMQKIRDYAATYNINLRYFLTYFLGQLRDSDK